MADDKKGRQNGWWTRNWWSVIRESIQWLTLIAAIALLIETKKQVQIAEDTSYKQLRAYVSIETPTLDSVGIRASHLKGTFTMKNTGQTVAFNVRQRCEFRIVPADSVEKVNPIELVQVNVGQPIFPNSGSKVWHEIMGQRKNFAGLSVHDYRLLYYGRIDYSDIYGVDHWTTFCYHYQLWIEGGSFYPDGPYNQTDNNGTAF
jgi:hypothetical protein